MAEIGLFPRGIVLLPTERVPLHIFEPRYRELIGECLEDDGEFGLIYADEEGVREIGTLARVAEVLERFAHGRINNCVGGGGRSGPSRVSRRCWSASTTAGSTLSSKVERDSSSSG